MSSCPCCGKPLPDTAQAGELCATCSNALDTGITKDDGFEPVRHVEDFEPMEPTQVQRPVAIRPPGVTVFAVLSYCCGVLLTLSAIMYHFSELKPELRDEALTVCVFVAALWFLAGWTFWTLRNWGRLMVIWLSIVTLLVGGDPSDAWVRALCMVLIWYLLRPNVKAAFGIMPEGVPETDYLGPDPHVVGT